MDSMINAFLSPGIFVSGFALENYIKHCLITVDFPVVS